MFDMGACGELESTPGKNRLFHQRDDGFAYVRTRGTPQRHPIGVSRAIPQPLRGTRRFKMGRPPHNSGYLPEPSFGDGPDAPLSGPAILSSTSWLDRAIHSPLIFLTFILVLVGVVIVLQHLDRQETATKVKQNAQLVEAAKSGTLEAVKQLLEAGAFVDARGSYNNTPLIWAAYRGRVDIVKLLLDKGATVDLTADDHGTALHNVVAFAPRQYTEEVVRVLLARGANPNISDGSGNTPLWVAERRGCSKVVKLLEAYGAH